MISELLKRVMKECNLKQTGLADLLGVSLSRVKAMTSGRVKNLTREESEALVSKLGIRAAWLVTGEGSMFDTDETQDEFIARHQARNRVIALLDAMPMREITRMRLSVLVTGDPAKDGPLIVEALSMEAQGIEYGTGDPLGQGSSAAASVLTPRQAALLDNYEHLAEPDKAALERTAFALAEQGKVSKKGQAA